MGWGMPSMSFSSMKMALQQLHRHSNPPAKQISSSSAAASSSSAVDCGCNWKKPSTNQTQRKLSSASPSLVKRTTSNRRRQELSASKRPDAEADAEESAAASSSVSTAFNCDECGEKNRNDKNKKSSSSSCRVHGKVEESVVVVKKSNDPFVDFRKSMARIVLEKRIYRPSELRGLLECFLSLNSPEHHGLIMEAFADICVKFIPRTLALTRSPSPCPSPSLS